MCFFEHERNFKTNAGRFLPAISMQYDREMNMIELLFEPIEAYIVSMATSTHHQLCNVMNLCLNLMELIYTKSKQYELK